MPCLLYFDISDTLIFQIQFISVAFGSIVNWYNEVGNPSSLVRLQYQECGVWSHAGMAASSLVTHAKCRWRALCWEIKNFKTVAVESRTKCEALGNCAGPVPLKLALLLGFESCSLLALLPWANYCACFLVCKMGIIMIDLSLYFYELTNTKHSINFSQYYLFLWSFMQ